MPAGAKEAGIALDARGNSACDERLRTRVAGHYALGDVAGQPQFTHVAWEDHRRLDAVLDRDLSRTRPTACWRYAMYIEPQVGRVGSPADRRPGAASRTASSRCR